MVQGRFWFPGALTLAVRHPQAQAPAADSDWTGWARHPEWHFKSSPDDSVVPTCLRCTHSQTWRTNFWLPSGRGMDREFGVNRCKLFHLDWISNEALLYSTGNNVKYGLIEHDGR